MSTADKNPNYDRQADMIKKRGGQTQIIDINVVVSDTIYERRCDFS